MRQKAAIDEQDKLTVKMLETNFLHHSKHPYKTCSIFDSLEPYGIAMDVAMTSADRCDFSSSFTSEDSDEISIQSYFAAMTPDDNLLDFPTFSDSSENFSSQQSCSNLKPESLELVPDNHLILRRLLSSYAEAMEDSHQELTEVIIKRINEKIDPLGEPLDRVAFSLFKRNENEREYLRQQSRKNFDAAFRAFYQWYPYGRFAHFAANSAIFEAIPEDTEMVHIVDFEIGNGIQWPPLIDAVLQKGKAMRLTSVKFEENCSSTEWNFYETKLRILDYAQSIGLKLKVEQITMEDLTAEVMKSKKKSIGKEWLAFNCMAGLPHMCSSQDRARAVEFIRWGKDLLAISTQSISNNAGIITLGEGKTGENLEIGVGYASFFNNQVMHYHALLDSMEHSDFPVYLTEARITMESLFVAQNICPNSWFQKWNEGPQAPITIGLNGQAISQECFNEAKEMVKEKESLYKVKIQGESENQLVLEWKGIPLVTVSSWK